MEMKQSEFPKHSVCPDGAPLQDGTLWEDRGQFLTLGS